MLHKIICFFCFVYFILYYSTVNGQQGSGTIEGTVLTADGKPGGFVTIEIPALKKAVMADDLGRFRLNNVKPGQHEINVFLVNYQPVSRVVDVQAGKTATISLALQLSEKQLEEVIVSSRRQSYRADQSSTINRMPVTTLENPQSIQVVTARTLKDQQVYTMTEAIRNVAGVSQHFGGQYNDYTMRGFRSDGGNFAYNGQRGAMNDTYSPQNLFNVEQIEVIKGPASVYFSAANPGGIINVVTKKPKETAHYSLDYSTGSWNLHRLTADATGAVTKNKKLLYRAIVGAQTNKSFRDFIGARTLFLAPSLTWRPTRQTDITLEYNQLFRKETGGGYYERGNIAIDNNIFALPIHWSQHEPTDWLRQRATTLQLTANHRFNQHFSITTIASTLRDNTSQAYHHLNWGSINNEDGVKDTLYRHYREYIWYTKAFMSNTFATLQFRTGAIRHTAVAGFDYGRQRFGFDNVGGGWANGGYNVRYTGVAPINVFYPEYGKSDPATYTGFETYAGPATNARYTGGYIQDLIELHPKVKMMLGLRYDRYRNLSSTEYVYFENKEDYVYDPANIYNDTSTAKAWIPRAGVVYMPVKNISVYASFCQSFLPQYSNMPNAGGPFPPEKGDQFEVGAKGEFYQGKLLTTVSLYRIHNRNVLNTDPANPNRSITNGLVSSKGFEITAQGSITRAFTLVASYAFNETRTLKDAEGNKSQFLFANAPKHMANLWVMYKLPVTALKGLKLGGGVYHIGERESEIPGQLRWPAYTIFGATIGYEKGRIGGGLNFDNITNQKYINGGFAESFFFGAPFNVRANISYML